MPNGECHSYGGIRCGYNVQPRAKRLMCVIRVAIYPADHVYEPHSPRGPRQNNFCRINGGHECPAIRICGYLPASADER